MRRFLHPNYKSFFSSRLLMTPDAANAFVLEVIDMYLRSKHTSNEELELPSYSERVASRLSRQIRSEDIVLTTKFTETEIPDNSIALHPIHGTVFAEYDDWGWYFSTKQFVDDVRLADENPKIVAHFLHVNSGGGEAWYLDIASEAVKKLKKPVVAYVDNVMASAAYYLAVNATEIYAGTKFDVIGSIGTMVSYIDLIPLLEKYGAKYIEEYADQSSLKNKKYNDLRQGKPKQFKEQVLNPLAAEFITAVQSARPDITRDEDIGVFKGQTFFSGDSETHGLIDGRLSLDESVLRAHALGMTGKEKQSARQKAMNLISN